MKKASAWPAVVNIKAPGLSDIQEVTHLVMTGERTGRFDKDLRIVKGVAPEDFPTYEGNATVTYDGTSRTGPPTWLQTKGSCPEQLPTVPELEATAESSGSGKYTIKVTASVTGVGANEADVDTQPVKGALIKTSGGADVYTDDKGLAVVTVRRDPDQPTTFEISAGDTLVPTTLRLPLTK
ncbi:hypothetical protein ACIBG0_40895 [Nocardia sp. NPDC050630]|uniref:hypothetical protein n=1 Tax=Nocardia sp. NPDC050630 TaxID=3364321 RepID=UPI00378E21DB